MSKLKKKNKDKKKMPILFQEKEILVKFCQEARKLQHI